MLPGHCTVCLYLNAERIKFEEKVADYEDQLRDTEEAKNHVG
jgi:hypothetical protein